MIKGYKDLNIWKKGIRLADLIYETTLKFPKEEMYGLSSQIRRSAVSVPSNIAEGSERGTKEFIRFLNISKGSLAELQTQLIIAELRKYIDKTSFDDLIQLSEEIDGMIYKLILKLKEKI